MDAKKLFNCLLSNIEHSGLNYFVSKTPFSANISLKCSFSKYFSAKNPLKKEQNPSEVDLPSKNMLKTFELENCQLKHEIESLERIVADQKQVINQQFEQKKKQEKCSEERASKFRAELLEIKSEKSKQSSRIRNLEAERVDNENLKQDIGELSKELKEAQRTLASKNSEIEALYKEKEKLTLSIEKLDVEINEARSKFEELNNHPNKCPFCDFSVENFVNMKTHVKEVHSETKEVRTELFNSSNSKFCEYLCYYCEKNIKSDNNLQLHRTMCFLRPLTEFPCHICGAQCANESDLGRHRTTYHSIGSICKDTGKEIFWCDMCPLNFQSKDKLCHHFKYCHGRKT